MSDLAADAEVVRRVAQRIRVQPAAGLAPGPILTAVPSPGVGAGSLTLVGAARWAHLPGLGKGPWQPPAVRRLRATLVGFVKPLVLLGFLAGALWAGSQALPHLFHGMGGVVPGVTHVKPSVAPPAPAQLPAGHATKAHGGHR